MPHQFPPEQQKIIDRVKQNGQNHVLRWLGELSEEQRVSFLDQLNRVDFEQIREFARLMDDPPQPDNPDDIEPAPVARLPQDEAESKQESHVISTGHAALERDRVAALTVAGGQGTRLGYDGPKGTLPVSPLRHHSLFRILAEKLLVGRRKYGCTVPWLIMTSPTNHEETRSFFEQQDFFGLREEHVHFFQQCTNPILGPGGKLLLSGKGNLLVGPDGHGGVFRALFESELAGAMLDQAFDLISYFQIDNPLVTPLDERFIGHHLDQQANFSCKVVPKRDPEEGLGVVVLDEGHPAVVEYTDLPRSMAEERAKSGELRYRFGSIAAHAIDVAFAREMGRRDDALPWHVVEKNYESLDQNGDLVARKCYKFERFVFDCLPHARGCACVEVRRESEFAPVKKAEGQDSPADCRRALHHMWVGWLKEAGVNVSELMDSVGTVEISPLFANSADELRERIPEGFEPVPPVLLE
jgi:UDP-N-acetylglucosamine/UDP-N-acetylgalactosamine diphosphorylase